MFETKTAENLCLGFGCWGRDFFAKVSATVYAVGGSYGRGGIVGLNGSDVTFEDKLDHIDPQVFNGVYSDGNANITFIKGIGLGSTQLGQAESKGLLTINI